MSQTHALSDYFMYWSSEEFPPNPFKIVDTRQVLLGRGDYVRQAHAVMATSMAMELFLAHNEWEEAEPIMKWLHTQHNDVHVHSSTQDTLMALQVLARRRPRDVTVEAALQAPPGSFIV